MRLLRFYTPSYRNLRDIGIVFTLETSTPDDDQGTIRFLVGPNGSGKTNLMRFLAAIFVALRDEYSGYRPSNPAYTEPFYLVYQLAGNTVTITSKGTGRRGLIFRVQSNKLSGEEGVEWYRNGELPSLDTIVPQTVLIYTSGAVDPWRDLIDAVSLPEPTPLPYAARQREYETGFDEAEAFREDDAEEPHPEIPKNLLHERLFLILPEYLLAALLAAFIKHYLPYQEKTSTSSVLPADFRDTMEEAQVESLLSFSLQVKVPSSAPMHIWQDIDRLQLETTYRFGRWGDSGDEELWVYDIGDLRESGNVSSRLLSRLAGDFEDELLTPFQFFLVLVDLQQAGILKRINLILNKKHPLHDEHRTILADNLSDGELALLERMALIHLLSEGERLFLFDEPEIHFNDTWKRNLIDHLERSMLAAHTNSEVILTTHSSITLTDAYAHEVIRLGYEGQQNVPLTLGTEPGEILQRVYGADADVGKRALRKIDEARGDHEQLRDLLNQVGPGYQRFRVVEELAAEGRDATSD